MGRLLQSFKDQLFGRWQRTPHKVNTLAHFFKVSNSSSFPPPACTESAEDPNLLRRTPPIRLISTSSGTSPTSTASPSTKAHPAWRGALGSTRGRPPVRRRSFA